MTSDEVWRFLAGLKGRSFETLDQRRRFTLTEVTGNSLTVRVESTGNQRTISRVDFTESWERLVEQGRLSRTEIHNEISRFNPAYVSTLLAQIPSVQYALRPIVLMYSTTNAPPPPPRQGDQAPQVPIDPIESETVDSSEVVETVADRLMARGRELGFEVQKEWRTELGSRIDVVWASRIRSVLPGLESEPLLPVVGIEIETSWRTRKHVKGDILNLVDLAPALGVIVLCQGSKDAPGEIRSLRTAAQRYATKVGLRLIVWSDDDVDRACNQSQ